ncbi:MAG: choice-of-anchor L domain-containing protein [Flavobacteriales bacterium]
MKKIFTLLLIVMLCVQLNAQVLVDNTQTVETTVEDIFLANGIFVANITFNGVAANTGSEYFGSFTDALEGIGMGAGLVMTTGHVNDAMYPEIYEPIVNSYTYQDPDLLALIPNEYYIGELASLEFDFIATGDSLDFIYVFGSDEYPEFVESAFNDHFGFFVSGPGIAGTFSNNAVNIALIPGTTESVGINTLNEFEHAEFYVDNNGNPVSVGFDAFTTPLHASIGQMVVGETYHVKLVIADVSDAVLDSGVFLKGDSFVQVCSPNANVMPEGCMLSSLHANVEYTEDCGTISLTNLSELNIETTGCYYEMGDGNETAACDANTMYTYTASGTYTVKLVYEINEFKAKFTVANLLISDTPPATPVITQTGNMLEVSNWDGTSTLQWYVNGATILGGTSNTVLIEESGSYTVTANNGCPVTSAAYSAVGLHELADENGFIIYPNPTDGTANVKLPKSAHTLQLFNMNGQLISAQQVMNQNTIQLSAASGVYSVRISDEAGSTMSNLIWMVK